MNVLLIGAGGREHALSWKIAQSKKLSKLYISPGNAGTAGSGENVSIDIKNHENLKTFLREHKINMLVIGPEAPLAEGITDMLKADKEFEGLMIVGPGAEGARLESSKDFAKNFMDSYGIPTAKHKSFNINEFNKAIEFLNEMEPPYVLKADGLAAGKGVIICNNKKDAENELKSMLLDKKFGKASEKVLIEEFLNGIELSVFVLTDGINFVLLPEAKDYKRIGEGDTGLNTGGMGSISPVPFANEDFMNKVRDRIIYPTISGLKDQKIEYKGFIFFGLMNVKGDPYVIEYNVRMGDPEAESVIPRIKSDLLLLFENLCNEKLKDTEISIDSRYCTSVMLVSGGYPGPYEKGHSISLPEKIDDSIIFHAGTKQNDTSSPIITNGGRVLAITAFGNKLTDALQKSYKMAEETKFKGKYYRKDLGRDLLTNN